MRRKQTRKVLFLILLLLFLPPLLVLVKTVQRYLSRATGVPANIVVDAQAILGTMPEPWRALAQGGEEKDHDMLSGVIKEVRALQPKYIRIDHIYDFYDVVSRNQNGSLDFHWEKLDAIVSSILKTGATPFFSLSYMPPVIAKDNKIINPPVNWSEWQQVVKATIEHYSGRNQKNIADVYYEVWNEPDLFGNWKIGGRKDYRLVYKYAVLGAQEARNTRSFKIGGPATTAPYRNWVDKFLDYVVKNNLRLDFYSWHRYSLQPQEFLNDVNRIDTWLFKNAGYTLPKFLTEWGSTPENSPFHDSNFDAAHLIATIRQLLDRVDLAFVFEIKDGPSPEGKKYWGRWGLMTHEAAGAIEKKPKYYALQLLNKAKGKRLKLEGKGTWVTGFATIEKNTLRIILTNLDRNARHFERVPLTIVNLENGVYSYREIFLLGSKHSSTERVTNNTLRKEVLLPPNSVVLIELNKS